MRRTLKVLAWICLSIGGCITAVVVWGFYTGRLQPAHRGCPLLVWLEPIEKSPILPSDSLEITWISAWGPPGTIRVFGDGRVERDDTIRYSNGVIEGCPLHAADRTLSIPASTPVALITKARDRGFCRLCTFYASRERIADAATTTITLHTGKTTHTVTNHAGAPPALYRELFDEVMTTTPPLPPYASRRTISREYEESCMDFERKQEIINARIEGRKPYF